MKIYLKFTLALILLLCLLKMPYGYYQFVRIACTVGFVSLLILKDKPIFIIIWSVAAILLNPVEKITFNKEVWNLIDVVIALLLILSAGVDIYHMKKAPNHVWGF